VLLHAVVAARQREWVSEWDGAGMCAAQVADGWLDCTWPHKSIEEHCDGDAWAGGHSHRDAHPGEDAVRRRGHNLQPLHDQRCSAVEVRLQVDELLFETVAVGLEAAKTRPFGASVAVAVPVSVGVKGEGWIT
jgi:hypothetical protein